MEDAVRVNPGDDSYGNWSPPGGWGDDPNSVWPNYNSGGGGGGGYPNPQQSGGGDRRTQASPFANFLQTFLGSGAPGLYPEGWQYPTNDPAAAVRNALRQAGLYGNPFNQAYQRSISNFSGGLVPQFYAQLNQSPGADYASIPAKFGNFIQGRLNGTIAAPTMQQASGNLGALSALLRQVSRAAGGVVDVDPNTPGNQAGDMSTPEGRAAMLAAIQAVGGGGLTPLQLAMAGTYLDPQSQMTMYLSNYLPVLGQGLTAGLGRATAPMQTAWDDYMANIVGGDPNTQFMSLLDMLTGSRGL